MIDNLPPRRELPPDVRDRIRLKMRAGIAEPARSRRPVWLAAAAVVVLAAGAVFATGVLRDRANGPVAPAAPATTGSAQLQDAVDRCWNAAKTRGKALALPRDWQLKIIFNHGTTLVLAAMVGDRPLFCETTLTSVTVSDPAAKPVPVPGTRSTVLLRTADGLIAGVADPAWHAISAAPAGALILPDSATPAWWISPVTHQFVAFTDAGPDVPVTLGPLNTTGASADALVTAPAPLVTTVDRPAPAERTSVAGKFLGECLAGSPLQLPDRDAWVAGAHLGWNGREIVVARLGSRVISCSARPYPGKPGRTYYNIDPDQQMLKPGLGGGMFAQVLAPVKETGEPEQSALVGGLPENVTRVSVTYPGGRHVDAVVAHGTFAVWHTDADDSSTVDARTNVKAYDAQGKLVIEASLKLI
ncbi:hypothetical protein VSH64_41990 [Amycolatopsis rhabdoformis]|uniref:Uncharacterized protein n=1 Tax=Amycolatopsis rhabdoformis TaxID=1448059 RepID=A0ABZ1I4G6_9PSEU|nr:hypothetical protein [Amycolatopsis rhabdoformis]WSE29311.1 hypothetical protein VSH64_41990 [Amycolatopsis rhabdoformis]